MNETCDEQPPTCMDCGEEIDQGAIDWYLKKRLERGKPSGYPKRCLICALDAIKEMVAQTGRHLAKESEL